VKVRAKYTWVLAALLGVASGGCGKLGGGANSSAAVGDHPLLGAPAPAFELPARSGSGAAQVAPGKVTVVDFWATWCEPCKDSFPAYQRLQDKYGDKLNVLGLSVDEAPDGIPAFAAETGAKFVLAWDEGKAVSNRYDPPGMPSSYIVDQNGIVRFVHSGFRSGDEAKIDAELASLIQ
jgi:cytochrome c biogenesis protein CcmG, thiol:disulfide interchange protein DsbE